ncbi:LysR family transcriptional regulator [Brevibacillus composti]|uniref:LysR family transcriptional regulator n=1 Tax=Brevibacillus composti TaxID=2796470 RepID=UPI001E5E88AD|nr:LysR family transcriptional regulator [Brevibacillus composti]
MNLHALRIFVEVAAKGSVTDAAASLSISQPAVSAQIRKLEAELGRPLLQAKGRGIALTAEGQFLFAKARRIFEWERELEREWVEVKAGRCGRLRLASTYLPAHYLVPSWIAAFKRRHEQVDVEILTGNSAAGPEARRQRFGGPGRDRARPRHRRRD